MEILKCYLILVAVCYIITSTIVVISNHELKDVLIISMLNVLYIGAFLFYRLLKLLAHKNGKRLLKRKIRTFGDFKELGLDIDNRSMNSVRTLFKMLFIYKLPDDTNK